MQNKTLQMKRALRTALFVLLLSVAGMGEGYGQTHPNLYTFDFSELCPSGQKLWYKIKDEANRYVEVVAPAYAYDYYMGNYEYLDFWVGYSKPTGDLVIPEQVRGYTVVGLSPMGWNYNNYYSGAFEGCTGLTSVVIPNTVKSIGASAFWGCDGLASITIPESVISIGRVSFQGCTGLRSVFYKGNIAQWCGLTFSSKWENPLSYSHNLYIDNTLITDLVIPDGVTSIGKYVFSGCSVTSITIPNSMTSIGEYAFSECSNLASITIPISVDTIGEKVFENCTSLQEVNFNAKNCTYMSSKDNPVFFGCTSLNTLHIGEQVQTIPHYAFYGCSGMTGGLIIPNSVTTIGKNAFYGCSGFTSLTIGNSIDTIGYGAFTGCSNIASLNYNATDCTAYIDNSSVFNCTALTELNIGENVQTIPTFAFRGCSGVTSLNIPNSVTSIGSSAFLGFNGTYITIPKSVASIGNSAFGNCPRLTTVYYNAENATGSSGFSNCPNLTTIHIGSDVQEIHPIFRGCSSVHLVVALGPTPAVLESNALTDIAENSILMVSCGNKLNYFSVWNMFDFNNIMEDCGQYPISMNNIGVGGSVSASTTQAQMGQEVQLTVTPNAGMVLSSLTVCNASDPTQTFPVYPIGKGNKFGFIMPPYGVSVNATFVAGTSVEENDNVPVSVYPNPTDGQVKIEAENIKHITISNMLGQTIFDGNASGNEFAYDFSKHKTGIYLIRIETASGVAVKKVFVTR